MKIFDIYFCHKQQLSWPTIEFRIFIYFIVSEKKCTLLQIYFSNHRRKINFTIYEYTGCFIRESMSLDYYQEKKD